MSEKEPFEKATNLTRLNSIQPELYLSLSKDGLTLFWSYFEPARPGGPGSRDIWYATRPQLGSEDFCVPMLLGAPINTPQADSSPGVSWEWPAHDSKFYFVRGGPGSRFDIFVATWKQSPLLTFRGDCNDDGAVNIADPVCVLNWLFGGNAAVGCDAALNTNGDAGVNITDAVSLLNFLFAGGPAPAAPFPDCGPGTLPADTLLGCANPPDCQ